MTTHDGIWQGIAGGGEGTETPLDAARREAFEEAGAPPDASYLQLDTVAYVPVTLFADSAHWGDALYVIPEYNFGVDLGTQEIRLSPEHDEVRWLPFAAARALLRYDSNRVALWELHQKIRGFGPREDAL